MGKATAAMALNQFPSSIHRYIRNNNKSLFNLRLGRNHSSHFNNSAAGKTRRTPPPTTMTKPALSVKSSSSSGASSADENPFLTQQNQDDSKKNIWEKWRANSAEMSGKLAKLGLSAVLAYGLFDAVTYTSFFVLAFLGYEKSTGKNPAANLQALLGIVILMWTGNNVTRPFRVAGAAALAPAIDKGLRKIQEHFKLPSLVYAFAVVVGIVASVCLTVIGLLVLSRWGK